MSAPCGRLGCAGGIGVWRPIVCFGPVGHAATAENTVRMQVGILFCDEHKEFDFKEFLRLNKDRLIGEFTQRGRAKPDLENAWLEFEPASERGSA